MFKEMIESGNVSDYDFGTGIWPVVNKNVDMKLNDKGEYINHFNKTINNFSPEEILTLKSTNLIFSDKNEDEISKELFSSIPNVKYNKKIGYYTGLYAGHVTEGKYRENASSGGFGTWIFKELLEKGHIDGVIHVKENISHGSLFKYEISRSIEDIIAGSKTKYYPVEMSEVLQIVKETPGRYAVIGLPSYVMDIRLLSEVDSIFKERIKFVIGLVCGHQKSTNFADFLAWQCGIEPGKLEHISFRKKFDDLPSNAYGIEVTGKINDVTTTITKNVKELFGYDWGQAFFKVRASDFTDDVMNEAADVTLGDAWLQKYMKDSKGNNIIIVRNPIINELIINAINEKRVNLDIVDEETIINSQISHYRHTQDELGYRLYKKEKKNEWYPKKRIMPNKQLPFVRKKIQDLREKICLLVPKYYKEAVKRNDLNYFIKKMQPLVKYYQFLYFYGRIERKLIKVIKKR